MVGAVVFPAMFKACQCTPSGGTTTPPVTVRTPARDMFPLLSSEQDMHGVCERVEPPPVMMAPLVKDPPPTTVTVPAPALHPLVVAPPLASVQSAAPVPL